MDQVLQDKVLDVAIVGAGISGLGVARALKDAGLRIGLFDSDGVCSKTSANSLRIIHGGFRYLQSCDVFRCIRSIRAQYSVQQQFPQYVSELPCVLALQEGTLRSPAPLSVASLFYSLCYASVAMAWDRKGWIERPEQTHATLLASVTKEPRGVFCWKDFLLTDPDGLHQSLAEELQQAGVIVSTDQALTDVSVVDEDKYRLLFNSPNGQDECTAKVVVNATGSSLLKVRELFTSTAPPFPIQWVRAANLVFKKQISLPAGLAFAGNGNDLFFLTPRDEHIAIGTFYAPYSATEGVRLTEEEVASYIAKLQQAAPGLELNIGDFVATDVGILPAHRASENDIALFSNERVFCDNRLINVVSTKYTTFLGQGFTVARLVKKLLAS